MACTEPIVIRRCFAPMRYWAIQTRLPPARMRTPKPGRASSKMISSVLYDLWVNGSVSDRLGGAVALLLFLHRRERALGRSKGQRREGEGRLRTRLFRTRPLALRARCLGLFRSIGIGGSLAAPPLPHHRTYGSVYGGSVD